MGAEELGDQPELPVWLRGPAEEGGVVSWVEKQTRAGRVGGLFSGGERFGGCIILRELECWKRLLRGTWSTSGSALGIRGRTVISGRRKRVQESRPGSVDRGRD